MNLHNGLVRIWPSSNPWWIKIMPSSMTLYNEGHVYAYYVLLATLNAKLQGTAEI